MASCQTVILSVEDEVGQRIIIDDLLEATRGADPGLRQAAVTMLNGYFARTRHDHSAHTRTLLSGLIHLLNDTNPEVLSQSWDAINAITKVRRLCSPASKTVRPADYSLRPHWSTPITPITPIPIGLSWLRDEVCGTPHYCGSRVYEGLIRSCLLTEKQ